MKEEKKKIFGVGMLVIMASFAIAFLVLSTSITQPIVENEVIELTVKREWSKPLGDADPGGDNSGFMYFMAKNHSANPTVEYASNLTNRTGGNANCYEWSDSLNTEMTGETPYATAFDFIVKFRVNDTVGYNTSSSAWEIDWVRANMTCDFRYITDVGALQEMTIIEIATSADFACYHGYLLDNDGGAGTGFIITHGETYNITALTVQGYY